MDKKYKKIINKLDNKTIHYYSYRSGRTPFITLGRVIGIKEPPEIVEIFKWKEEAIIELIPYLIESLNNPDRDFAVNFVLYALTGEDASSEQYYYKVEEWKKYRKMFDCPMWKRWWGKNKDNLIWKENPDSPHKYSLQPKQPKKSNQK